MKNKAYVLVFDGFADWEAALIMCELKKMEQIEVVTVGFTKERIHSMGGLKVIPDISLEEVQVDGALIFIMPGGEMWEGFSSVELSSLLQKLHESNVYIAAICGATLFLAKEGFFNERKHTSNSKSYLKENVPSYKDGLYQEKLAVTDDTIITASGLGCIEFAFEILEALSIYDKTIRKQWFDLFKHAKMPV
jgi:putative intracellular protease/amidase